MKCWLSQRHRRQWQVAGALALAATIVLTPNTVRPQERPAAQPGTRSNSSASGHPGPVLFTDVVTARELDRQLEGLQARTEASRRAVARLNAGSFRSRDTSFQTPFGPKIVNGLSTARYPTAGALVKTGQNGRARSWCSGTLIGCNTFLTAAHCVANDRTPGSYSVFLQHGGWRDVAAITPHPEYVHPSTHGDVALIKLRDTAMGRPVGPLRIVPSPINRRAPLPFDTMGTIVGFGRSGGNNFDYGLKREGGVRTTSCAPDRSDQDLVCWSFEALASPPGENSNTCNVDSGGPLFVDGGNGTILLAGVTSGGTRSDCMPSDHTYDSNVFTYSNWIAGQAGADLAPAACGNGPQVTQDGTRIQASQGQLSADAPEMQVDFPILRGRRLVRVALNGTDDDITSFDYFVRVGGVATDSQFDCRPSTGQYAFCEYTQPDADLVSVLVRRKSGAGAFLFVVTEFD